jgi:hypothetical protein
MTNRIALSVIVATLFLLGLAVSAQSQEVEVKDVKMFAGQWIGKATLHNTTVPSELSIKEDGTYSGHVGNRSVGGSIQIVGGESRYVGTAIQGRLSLYQGSRDRRFLRAWADSGEIMEYQERK